MKEKTKENSWHCFNIIAPLIMFVIGGSTLTDKTPIYFFGAIWVIFTLVPVIISKSSKWKTKRKDIFYYKYSNPLMAGIIITSAFLIFTLNQEGTWFIVVTLIVFIIMYAINHTYISKKYPEYYFK